MRMVALSVLSAVLVLFACTDAPTDLDPSVLSPDHALFKNGNGNGASGALEGPPEDLDLTAFDTNGNDLVCVKTVPEGKGKAATRTIVKDDQGGTCPGGFEEYALGGGELPLCTAYSEGYPSTDLCDCAGLGDYFGWELRPDGYYYCVQGG